MAFSALALTLTAAVVFISISQGGASHRFTYEKEGQSKWGGSCGGRYQSPIHIVSHRAISRPLPALEMVHYRNLLPSPVKLLNTGHSVSLKPSHKNGFHRPQVFGALLAQRYELDSLHFHWGHRNSRGSEHIMNGIRFPVEMHIIHRNMKYKNISEAISHTDGLTVLAFFYQVQQSNNKKLDPILKAFRKVHLPEQETSLNSTFTLASLLNTNLDVFYTYHGSLTTPPCSESVTWIVFPDPLYMSFNQIKKFRRVMSGETHMSNNFRSIQPLNKRIVYVRNMWKYNRDGRNSTRYNNNQWFQGKL